MTVVVPFEQEKPKKVLCSCKICGKKLREGDQEGLRVLQSVIARSTGKFITSTIAVWSCPECRVIYELPPGIKLVADESLIITPH
jgi:hypothetical protein